jgi:hypothetical protein
MWRRNQIRKEAPIAKNTAIKTPSVSACRIPNTTQNMPTADRTAPTASNGRLGSGSTGSAIRRLRRTIAATTSAWNTKAARRLIALVMRPPISGPAAAPTPPSPLITPNARAREVRSSNAIVARM